jgi:hypothetical protein
LEEIVVRLGGSVKPGCGETTEGAFDKGISVKPCFLV